MLIRYGADTTKPDIDGATPEDYAIEQGSFKFAHAIRYYRLNNLDTAISMIPILANETANTASRVKNYVDFVLTRQNFSEIANYEGLSDAMQTLKWSEFDVLDKLDSHLESARITARSWDIEIFPQMRSLYQNLGNFGNQYLRDFQDIEPKLYVLKNGAINETLINEELDYLEEEWIMQGKRRAERRRRRRIARQRLRKEQTDLDAGFKKVFDLAKSLKTQSSVYRNGSIETRTLLNRFKNDLETDKENFEKDSEDVSNCTVITQENLWTKGNETLQKLEEIGAKNNTMQKLVNEINEVLADTKIMAASVAAIKMTTFGFTLTHFVARWQKGRYEKKLDYVERFNINKGYARKKFEKYRSKMRKLGKPKLYKHPIKWNARRRWDKKYDKLIDTDFQKKHRAEEFEYKISKNSMKHSRWKWAGRSVKGVTFVGNAVSFGLMISQLIKSARIQREQDARIAARTRLRSEINGLLQEVEEISEQSRGLRLLSSTKREALELLTDLTVKVDNAIAEVDKLGDLWEDIELRVGSLSDLAAGGLNLGQTESADKSRKFGLLFGRLRDIEMEWNQIRGFAFDISDILSGSNEQNGERSSWASDRLINRNGVDVEATSTP